ncbi:PREDICTED: uncharacterized protein LOC109484933 isoform X2 [Branchiostoma belcheri]|uniref:Uncharacterized protein LOC109484933 isoform X2 n=1 Tax=Branchiostoma belcheri TaxID=7741 RepID=A0A6P5AL95_BRABE|nr:PREDICTED: uncharacterized protein LOC109484933 isoform X2 [Branchiostoma belcheri]
MSDVSPSEEKIKNICIETEILERALLYQAQHAVASEERLNGVLDEMEAALGRKDEETQALIRRKDCESQAALGRKDEELRIMREYVEGIKKERDAALKQRDALNKNLMAHIDRIGPLLRKGRNAD